MIDQLRNSVTHISNGLTAEQETAQRCLLETRATQSSLLDIEGAVADARGIAQTINNSAQEESQRAQAMRGRLIHLITGINETDIAITRLAESAEQQNALANRVMAATNVVRFELRR